MYSNNLYGFPTFDDIADDDADLIGKWSLKSATDVPNPSGKADGGTIEHDSDRGMRSLHGGTDAQQRYHYLGPSPAAGAWSSRDAELALHRGFTIGFEIERAAFQRVIGDLAGTGNAYPLQFRGGTTNALFGIGRPSDSGLSINDGTFSTNELNVTNTTSYFSKHTFYKPYAQIHISFNRGRINLYVDGYHANSWAVTNWTTTHFDRFYLGGRSATVSSTPPGFPYWWRNLFMIKRRIILPVDSRVDRMTFIGDSWIGLGDYYTGSPKVNSSHVGSNSNAGICPMMERLMAADGLYVNDLHNSGRTGARLVLGTGASDIFEQVNGSPSQTYFDALTSRGRIAVTIIGGNDAIGENSTVEDMRTNLNDYLDLVEPEFEHHFLLNVPDISGGTSIHTQAVALQRTQDINAMYVEECADRTVTHLLDFYTALGPYDSANMKSDTIHLNEYANAQILAPWLWSQMRPYVMEMSR